MRAAIDHPETDVVVVAPAQLPARGGGRRRSAAAGKAVLCTKPLGRTADEARRMLEAVETAGVFARLPRGPRATRPRRSRRSRRSQDGAIGEVTGSARARPIPGRTAAWFWDGRLTGGGAIIDLGCHCIEIVRSFVGKGNRPVEVMCCTDTLVHPIDAEDNAIALVRFESGAIGQFEVSWTFRGGMDLRDEVAGTHGTIWLNHFLRTGFEMFTAGGAGGGYVAEKAETAAGWLFPVGDEVVRARLRRHVHRHVRRDRRGPSAARDALRRLRRQRDHGRLLPLGEEPRSGSRSSSSGAAARCRASASSPRRYEGQVVIKREILPDGRHKLILKDEPGRLQRPGRRGA